MTNGNGHVADVPKIKDVLGEALPRVGTYKHLDNTKQVVALIDDVSVPYIVLDTISFSLNVQSHLAKVDQTFSILHRAFQVGIQLLDRY